MIIRNKSKLRTKARVLSLAGWIKKAQEEFNRFIRNRDRDEQCITCNTGRIEHACHFYNAGQYTALRFNELNVHGGCRQCNYFKHGSLETYRRRLENKIGKDKLDLLDSIATRNRVKKWSRSELQIIYEQYKQLNEQAR